MDGQLRRIPFRYIQCDPMTQEEIDAAQREADFRQKNREKAGDRDIYLATGGADTHADGTRAEDRLAWLTGLPKTSWGKPMSQDDDVSGIECKNARYKGYRSIPNLFAPQVTKRLEEGIWTPDQLIAFFVEHSQNKGELRFLGFARLEEVAVPKNFVSKGEWGKMGGNPFPKTPSYFLYPEDLSFTHLEELWQKKRLSAQ